MSNIVTVAELSPSMCDTTRVTIDVRGTVISGPLRHIEMREVVAIRWDLGPSHTEPVIDLLIGEQDVTRLSPRHLVIAKPLR